MITKSQSDEAGVPPARWHAPSRSCGCRPARGCCPEPAGAANGGRRPAGCMAERKEHSAVASQASGSGQWGALCGDGDGKQDSQGCVDGTGRLNRSQLSRGSGSGLETITLIKPIYY